jgi:arsenate reductase (thioredoxin)
MSDRIWNVLFLCTGNSARSIMAEALLNVLGGPRFRAFSAGSHPTGKVQPMAIALACDLGYPEERLRSKSWDEFAHAPAMDIVITVCDAAAGEACPFRPGTPIVAHWSIPDPAAAAGDETARRKAYRLAWDLLQRRIRLLLALPLDALDAATCAQRISEIGGDGTGLTA